MSDLGVDDEGRQWVRFTSVEHELLETIRKINCGPHQECSPELPCTCRQIAREIVEKMERNSLPDPPARHGGG